MTKITLTAEELRERAEKIDELASDIGALVGEVEDLLDGTGQEAHARSYVIAHLRIAIGGDHGYLDRYSDSLEKVARSLREAADEVDGGGCDDDDDM